MRIVVFVGSPIEDDEKEVKLTIREIGTCRYSGMIIAHDTD